MTAAPKLTVAVSTFRRKASLARLLDALAHQDLAPQDFEVVVYDDASADGTADLVRQLAATLPYDVRVLEGERNRGPAHGRNTAWRAARAPIVAFTDDDCVPAPGWLSHGCTHFADRSVGVVVGHVEPAPDQRHLLGPFSRTLEVNSARFFATANCFYRREALEVTGGFDERFRRAAGEDTDLGLRVIEAGWSATYAGDALVHHDVRPSELRAAAREAWSKWIDLGLVVRKHPEVRRTLCYRYLFWKKPHALVLLAVAGVVIAATLTPMYGPLSLTAFVTVLPYLRHRLVSAPLARGRRALTAFPGTLLIDLLEVGTMLRSSVRYRRLIF